MIAARKLLKIEPLLNKELEKLLRFSEFSPQLESNSAILQECINLLHDNLNILKVGGGIPTKNILGNLPFNLTEIIHEKEL